MDFSSVAADEWVYVGVLFVGMVLGKALSMESRVLSALLVVALLAPTNFAAVGLAAIVAAIMTKLIFQFQHWI